MIKETLELIEKQIGLRLQPCDHFTGIKENNGKKYFNVILKQRTCESVEYDLLKRLSEKYKTFSVQPNGFKRVAIFIN